MKEILNEFKTKVEDDMERKHANKFEIQKRNFDEWNFWAAHATRKAVESLIQLYQRQHQPVPISREAQESLEEKSQSYGDGVYRGNIHLGQRHGHGSFRYKNGDHYDGEWKNDKKMVLESTRGQTATPTKEIGKKAIKKDMEYSLGARDLQRGMYIVGNGITT